MTEGGIPTKKRNLLAEILKSRIQLKNEFEMAGKPKDRKPKKVESQKVRFKAEFINRKGRIVNYSCEP